MGVCFSCGPSNGHKAGSVCPLGCWNVHCGQQAASVLLNRSCPSYCTSCTMSFSLSLALSFSLYEHIQRMEQSHSDWCCAIPSHITASTRYLTRHWDVALISSHLYEGQRSLVTQGLNASHCRRGTISPGTPQSMLTLCMWEKKSRCWKGWRVFPSSFCSHDHLRTTRPHDFDMTGNHPLCGGKKKLFPVFFFIITKLKGSSQGDTRSVQVILVFALAANVMWLMRIRCESQKVIVVEEFWFKRYSMKGGFLSDISIWEQSWDVCFWGVVYFLFLWKRCTTGRQWMDG